MPEEKATDMKIMCDKHDKEMVYNPTLSWHRCPHDMCWKTLTDEELVHLTSSGTPVEIRVT